MDRDEWDDVCRQHDMFERPEPLQFASGLPLVDNQRPDVLV
jgi:hypothetical protein